MSLQLPARGAPPSNYAYADPTDSSASASASASTSTSSHPPTASTPLRSSLRARRAPASPFIASRGTASGSAAANASNTHCRDHRTFGNAGQGSASVSEQSISEMEDVAHLEDMLRHTDAMLRNPTVCANVTGGQAGLQTRLDAISARLDHLYSVQGIDRSLQDTSLDDDASPLQKEDPDALESLERLSLSGSRGPSSPNPNSSPSTRRNWKQDILDRANASNGKITQLSLAESLSLQEKESRRYQAERLAYQRKVEEEAKRLARKGMMTSNNSNKMAGGKSVSFEQSLAYDASNSRNDFDEDDYDWSSQGYYHEEEG